MDNKLKCSKLKSEEIILIHFKKMENIFFSVALVICILNGNIDGYCGWQYCSGNPALKK